LDAVLDFGLAYVREQWLRMLEDEDAAPPKDACVDVERKLANIEGACARPASDIVIRSPRRKLPRAVRNRTCYRSLQTLFKRCM
jgi:hypothetical protein